MDSASSKPGSSSNKMDNLAQKPSKLLNKYPLMNPSRSFPKGTIHPGLIPGLSVEDTPQKYPTNRLVFVVGLLISAAVILWAAFSPQSLNSVGTDSRDWVVENFGWFFTALVVVILIFMFVVGYGPTGKIRLGADDSEPEFSTASWISMLFAAGLGIALIFYGPMEPLTHFLDPAPATDAVAGSPQAVQPAMAQAILHQTISGWSVYALVGGAIAYSAFRRGRLPLISSLFEPVFPNGNNRILGKIIDIFAVMVTLFGTATSLGIGALQIRTGTSIVTGKDLSGNTFVVVAMTFLTVLFIFSAVSGIKKGIRFLSNVNMLLVIVMAAFVLLFGPTLFILDLLPTSIYTFVGTLPDMLSVTASQGADEKEFLSTWTVLYFAWWISWSPFVGMFIAKISKGRTLRQFVTVVILAPSGIIAAWFTIFGGTAIWMNQNGMDMEIEDSGENVMFDLLGNLPLGTVMSVVAVAAVVIFFVTAADSATNVMASMSQYGRPIPSRAITIIWGVALGLIAIFLLLAGGPDALSGLQAIMVTCSLPFAIILIGIMISWSIDLSRDPYIIRRKYARQAIEKGVERGIGEHGDDFVFGTDHVESDEGAGADFESDDPSLTEWYTDAISSQEPNMQDTAVQNSDAQAPPSGTGTNVSTT
ncbi:BCCT family transporter [Actinomycetaceae bacterium MB13-C1-2]|nr:BCCT family transporter [Actinomycetaceae bacterium MB13-C1-2]